MKTTALRHLATAFLLATIPWASVRADTSPRDELLRLVPEDTGFCIVFQNLREHSNKVSRSPFKAVFEKSPLGAVVSGLPELQQLQDFEKKLQTAFQLDFGRIRDDILGDAVVLSYRPGSKDRPDQEQDLILIRARDAKLLAEFLDRINKVQKDSGDLKELEVREHLGRSYVRRQERVNVNFTFLDGRVVVVSSKEEAIKEAIARSLKSPEVEPPLARRLNGLGTQKSLAVGWVNPRAFDESLALAILQAKDTDTTASKTVLACWHALDEAALIVDLDKELRFTLAAKARTDKMPPGIRKFLTSGSGPSSLWRHFPENALVAAAGKVSPADALEALGEFLKPEDRKALLDGLEHSFGATLGQNFVADILPHVGPDWGFCVTAPPKKEGSWFPRVVAGVKVGPGQKTPPVDRALLSSLDSYAMFTVLDHNRGNKEKLSLKTELQDKVEVKYLVHDSLFPPGVRPSYALTGGYLVVASCPEAIRDFNQAKGVSVKENGETPLLRVSPKIVLQFFRDQRDPLSQAIADKNKISKTEASAKLEGLFHVLPLFDDIELVRQPHDDQLRLTLRLRTVEPLAP